MRRKSHSSVYLLSLIALVFATCATARAQEKLDGIGKERVRAMLETAYETIQRSYYDPAYHGLDWDARYKQHKELMEGALSYNQGFTIVADLLDGLNDSHTFFIPPERPFKIDYGYRLQIIGDRGFIVGVRPGTDADGKVHAGDEVISLNDAGVNRLDMEKLNYVFRILAPQSSSQLVMRDASGAHRQVEVKTEIRKVDGIGDMRSLIISAMVQMGEAVFHPTGQRWAEVGNVMVWKMSDFELADSYIDHTFEIARKHAALVLDLRGNPGGAVVALQRVVGSVMDHDVRIYDRHGQKQTEPLIAKSRKADAFPGKLIVIVESDSASAAELFARVVQLERRGVVLGDRTSGSVMESQFHPFSHGFDSKIFYGIAVTDADLIMADGKSLEHSGVIPDEVVLPTPEDLAADRDPALARAIELAGGKLDPTAAGKILPYEWPPL